MRVLHVINSLAPGGAENMVQALVPELQRIGVDAELLVLTGSKQTLSGSDSQSIRFSVAKNLYSLRQVQAIRREMRGFDIVHAHLFPSLMWVACSRRLSGKPEIIFTEHSTFNRRRTRTWWKPVDEFVYGRYNWIVCISGGVREKLVGYLPALEKKSCVVYNGIDIGRFSRAEVPGSGPILEELGLRGDRRKPRILACVANLHPRKGQDVLMAALRELPSDVHVLLAGAGEYEEQLQRIKSEYGLQARVHFLGYRTDTERIYRAADCCVIPSRWEGFGLVAVEAMASGVPVVASDLPGLREVVGDAALLFPPAVAPALARRVRELLQSPELQEKCVRKGLQQAQQFTLERMAQEYMELYKSVLSKQY